MEKNLGLILLIIVSCLSIVEGDNVSGTPVDIFNKSNISSEELAQYNSVYISRCKFIHK